MNMYDNMKGRIIILFFHPKCSHCISLKPTWEKMKELNKDKKIVEVNAERMDEFNHPIKEEIRGFPQIFALNNGKIQEEFLKERTLENLNDFVLKNTNFSNINKNLDESLYKHISLNKPKRKYTKKEKPIKKKPIKKKAKTIKKKPKKTMNKKGKK